MIFVTGSLPEFSCLFSHVYPAGFFQQGFLFKTLIILVEKMLKKLVY
jgi:hypothetical protein